MSETDRSDNVFPLSDFEKFTQSVKDNAEAIEAGITAAARSYPRRLYYSDKGQEQKLENFTCRICKSRQGYSQIEIVLDVVLGGIPKTVVVGYSCDSCSATFTNPQKFSLYEEKDQT